MEKHFYFVAFILLINSPVIWAQNHFNIRLFDSNNFDKNICYNVQLASADGVDLNLAGQNYRLFYDGTKLQYNSEKSHALLPDDKYTQIIVKDNLQNIDASGAGVLSFDKHLSFLNIGNDLKDEINGGIVLPASGEWISTANVCFKLVLDKNSYVESENQALYWARPSLTESYATAYVEIAEWINPDKTVPLAAASYFDEEISTSLEDENFANSINIYPNPTNDKLFIDFDGQGPLLIEIYTVHGQLLKSEKYPANAVNYTVDLENFAAGLYQIKISDEYKKIVRKIEKM